MAQSHPDQQLSPYLDGALAADERRAVAAHLAGCPPCRARLAELQGVVRLVAALPERAPRRSLVPRRGLPRWLVPARWTSSLAAAVFALAFVVTNLPVGGGATTALPAFAPANAPAAAPAPAQSPNAALQGDTAKEVAPSASAAGFRSVGVPTAAPQPADQATRATAVPRGSADSYSVAQRSAPSAPASWLWLVAAALAAALAVIFSRWPRTLVR